MYVHIHVCVRAHTHVCTHTHTHIHVRAHTHRHTCAHTHSHTRTCTYTCAHTHTRAHTHTHIHVHAHTRVRAHTHSHTCAHTPTLTYTCTHTHSHTCAHTLTHTCTYTRAHTHSHTCAHTCTLAHVCTHTHTHIHVCTHKHIHKHTHTHVHTHNTHTRAHTYTHSHTHVHTLTHVHRGLDVRLRIKPWKRRGKSHGSNCPALDAFRLPVTPPHWRRAAGASAWSSRNWTPTLSRRSGAGAENEGVKPSDTTATGPETETEGKADPPSHLPPCSSDRQFGSEWARGRASARGPGGWLRDGQGRGRRGVGGVLGQGGAGSQGPLGFCPGEEAYLLKKPVPTQGCGERHQERKRQGWDCQHRGPFVSAYPSSLHSTHCGKRLQKIPKSET